MVTVLAVASLVYESAAASAALLGQLSTVIGDQAVAVLSHAISSAESSQQASKYALISLGVTLVGAGAITSELAAAFKQLLGTPTKPTASTREDTIWSSAWAIVRLRLLTVAIVIGIAFLLFVSLAIDGALSYAATKLPDFWIGSIALSVMSFAASVVLVATLFALLMGLLSPSNVSRQSIIVGSVFGSLLFAFGKTMFALYVSRVATESAFGAAAALAVLLLWLYFSSGALLFAVELAKHHHAKAPSKHVSSNPYAI